MALGSVREQYERYVPRENSFYRDHYHHVLIGLMVTIVMMMMAVAFMLYQLFHQPLPVFTAIQPDHEKMLLIPYNEPNLLPDTILQWASKAATAAYTFDFAFYKTQIAAARPYFTEKGWNDYIRSLNGVVITVIQNKLFVNGVVSGAPVISNQGPLPGRGYVWRIQIPFLVTYVTAETVSKRSLYVVLTIVRVPTNINPQGIGIDQFVMV